MTIRKIAAIRRIAGKTNEGYIHTVNEFELWDVHGDTIIMGVYPVPQKWSSEAHSVKVVAGDIFVTRNSVQLFEITSDKKGTFPL